MILLTFKQGATLFFRINFVLTLDTTIKKKLKLKMNFRLGRIYYELKKKMK